MKIFQSKESKYISGYKLIRHLGEIKEWWDESPSTMPTGHIKPENQYDTDGTLVVDGYSKDFYIEVARFAINKYSYELNFKGRIELDKNILDVIRTELPILKGMNIVFYDIVDCREWCNVIAQSSKQIYII